MKNIILLIIFTLVVAMTLTSCCSSNDNSEEAKQNEIENLGDFVKLGNTNYKFGYKSSMWCDRTTGVIYLMITGTYVNSFTVLLNADGTPKLWKEENHEDDQAIG